MQSFILTDVSNCGLLILVISSFSSFLSFYFFCSCVCVCVCVCISVCMCVRILQFHVCRPMIMSSIQNQILDMTIKRINKINVKYIRIHVYGYTEWVFATNLSP